MDAVQGIFSLGMSMGQAPKQLQKELHRLKELKLPAARLLISRSEWVMFKDKNLEALVLQLKYATYDAEDLLRRFEDQAQRQRIEDASRGWAGQTLSSYLNNLKHFVLRTNESIRDAEEKLDNVMGVVEKVLCSMGLDGFQPVQQLMPTTTETIAASEIFGRDTEREQLMEMLGLGVTATIDREDEINQVVTQMIAHSGSKGKSTAGLGVEASTLKSAKRHKGDSSSAILAEATNITDNNVSVLPIFGIGGIGKTALAQLIYNDKRVTTHFTVRIWVCVSDLFDIDRMTKEIVRTICPNFNLSSPLGVLQDQMMEELKSQMFVLVLDDIWEITEHQWDSFSAPLRNGLEGSMILVTTRHENIARMITTTTCKPVQLEGLPNDVFWEFFKKCAFGKECPNSYPDLQVIGRSISSKLRGTPLAAKTVGHLLNSNLTEQNWMTINNSELWEQEQKEGDILPALRLSYLYLPTELRRCFAFCSIFPKDYSFERHEIVDIWVAEGLVAPRGCMHLEDVGVSYLDELRGRCLFQSDPKFPHYFNRYVMHDLIHDTAQYVSMHECFLMTDLSYSGKHEFRHMSVEVDGESLSTMKNIQYLDKLRSLRFGTKLDTEITWFSQLSNILFLSLKGCKFQNLPQSICELSSLRYLDISESRVKEVPEEFWCLYSLQGVNASQSRMETIHKDVTKLINLRRLNLPEKACIALSKLPGLGNLSRLRNLSYFTVRKQKWAIAELKGMNQLRGWLAIKSIHFVKSQEEAAAARLVDKKYLEGLELYWRNKATKAQKPIPDNNEVAVADSLRPHERIECLKVQGFLGNRLPSWFNPKDLQSLRRLDFSSCHCLETFSIPHSTGSTECDSTGQHPSRSTNCRNNSSAFTHLTSITIFRCDGLKNLDHFLSPKNLPSVESIRLWECTNLESIPADRFVGFVHLRDLRLWYCRSVVCPQSQEMVLPHSLRRLYINSFGQLDRSFPSCIENLTSLAALCLRRCDNVKSIPLDSIACRDSLEFLLLENCPELSSIGGSDTPSSIKYVKVENCAKLTQVSQPFKKDTLSKEEKLAISAFCVSL